MDKVRIVNWLLTRKCNLRCDYCAIVRNYKNKPPEYPDMKHYYENEMSTETVIEGLKKFKLHNPDCFHIFYGGEPLLRVDLSDIINYCNEENIHYTIITNNSDEIQERLTDLFLKTDYIKGLTSSVDPVIFDKNANGDIVKKSTAGLKRLTESRFIFDLVAEITVTQDSVSNLYLLVKELSDHGISSSITFIDIAKSPYYDFSNVHDQSLLVHPTAQLAEQFKKIFGDKLDVHMGKELVKKIWDILPSSLNCEVEKDVHNITVDSDGSVRLCLRIRGTKTPEGINLSNFLRKDGELSPFLKLYLMRDKKAYCRKCNWTCVIMSEMINKDYRQFGELMHTKKRSK